MRKTFALALGLLAAMTLAGCLSTANTIGNADPNMAPTPIRQERLITDRALARRLQVVSLNGAINDNGLMEVQLEAVNTRTGFWSGLWSSMTGDTPYEVDYKVIWLNSQGMVVDSLMSTWRRVTVIPGETLYIHSVAPNQECQDFRINIKAVK